MGIFGRIADIFKANVNDALDKAEDPEKMIKQMVIEMQEAVVKATSGLAQAMGNEKRLEKQMLGFKKQAEDWNNKAMAALKAGNEDLARQALTRKTTAEQQYTQYQQMHSQASTTVTGLKQQVDDLKRKLDEARMKQSTLIARSQNAKAQKEIAQTMGGLDTQSSFAKFDKFEDKIMKLESEAQAFSELSGDSTSLDDEFKALETNSAVDDELAKMKAQLEGGSDS